jgi:hypothetical protein
LYLKKEVQKVHLACPVHPAQLVQKENPVQKDHLVKFILFYVYLLIFIFSCNYFKDLLEKKEKKVTVVIKVRQVFLELKDEMVQKGNLVYQAETAKKVTLVHLEILEHLVLEVLLFFF